MMYDLEWANTQDVAIKDAESIRPLLNGCVYLELANGMRIREYQQTRCTAHRAA